MPLYGYVRVSSIHQDLRPQRTVLRASAATSSGPGPASDSRRDGRNEPQVLLDLWQPGDTLIVTRIDRRARSMKDLQYRA